MLRLPSRRRFDGGATPIVLVLVLTLALAGALAYAVWLEERAHHATTDRVVREYAASAAWRLADEVTRRGPAAALDAPLLPPGSDPGDLVVGARIRDTAGAIVAARGDLSAIGVQATAAVPGRDDLVAEVTLDPARAELALLGGPPACRIPVFAALVLVAAGLVVLAARALRRERELARLRGEFVASVSHELRTPLTQIRMYAETLRLGWARTEGDRARAVRVIEQEAVRLSHLVDNVLALARTERPMPRVRPRPELLAPLVRDAAETFAPLAAARGCVVRCELDPALESPVDRDALRQVLLNLLDNAAKYAPRSDVQVRLRRSADAAMLEVLDRGPGIPPADAARVWEPFVRLRRAGEGGETGSGIGLAVVRRLVELHGGRVGIAPRPGGGTRVTVLLPLAGGSASAPSSAPAPAARPVAAEAVS